MLQTEPYLDQLAFWPQSGRHILAQFDTVSIVVYQAFRSSIAQYSLDHGYFGGSFSYDRMSWIKTNFIWMMYRSGWGTKPCQEFTLAIRIKRGFFDDLLTQAVESVYDPSQYTSLEDWKSALAKSSVRMQWDPDHLPGGPPLQRRALQLGLRGRILEDYGRKQVLEIIDLSSFVADQRDNLSPESSSRLLTPLERVYLPVEASIRQKLHLDDYPIALKSV